MLLLKVQKLLGNSLPERMSIRNYFVAWLVLVYYIFPVYLEKIIRMQQFCSAKRPRRENRTSSEQCRSEEEPKIGKWIDVFSEIRNRNSSERNCAIKRGGYWTRL